MKTNKEQIIKNAINELLETFESGKMPKQMACSIIRRRQDDTTPQSKWSTGNQILAMLQGTMDARGFRQWMSVNRRVKKGTHAIYILAPMKTKIKKLNTETNEVEEISVVTGFNPIPVFRMEDTEGDPLPFEHAYEPKTFPPFFDVAEKLGVKVSYAPCVANYYGKFSLRTNSIELCSHDAVVFFHELSHSIHATTVDLKTYDSEKAEIVAEFSACVLCELCNIHEYEKQGYDYIAHYCKKDSAAKPGKVIQKIMSVLTDVEKIINVVLDASEDVREAV